MKHKFEMTWDQVDAVVIAELKDAYEREMYGNEDDLGFNPSTLCESIKTVLNYFMVKEDYDKWIARLDG